MRALDIEIALMQKLNVRKNIIVPNVSWGIAGLHECDLLILSQHNYASEIEIKCSKSDLLKDKLKSHGHYHQHIARFFFAVPSFLEKTALQNIPNRAGLYIIDNNDIVKLVKQCRRNNKAVQWSAKERIKLAHLGTMRILGLKRKICRLS